jgi:hypothetical protein
MPSPTGPTEASLASVQDARGWEGGQGSGSAASPIAVPRTMDPAGA